MRDLPQILLGAEQWPGWELLLALVAATFISEDLTCISAGLLAAYGALGLAPAIAACLTGIFLGDVLLFAAGRYLGHPLVRRPPLKWWLTEADLVRSESWFRRTGPAVILLSRLLPGSRLPTYVAAGVLGMPFLQFAGWFLLGALVWTPLVVGLAAVLGAAVVDFLEAYQRVALGAFVGVALACWAALTLVRSLSTFKGRRLLLSRWRRLTRWEFWPPWAFYPPVAIYLLVLGVRFRGLTTFTACNPSIPAGGFIGESKYDILKGLKDAEPFVAQTACIAADASVRLRLEQVWAFLRLHQLELPIVIKPDVGQRGQGVVVANTIREVEAVIRSQGRDLLVQEYVPGVEFGVFYYRYPDEARGVVWSVTEKQFPRVTGDGRHTLEHLILAHPRAVCMAPYFLRLHQARLADIPPAGETVSLIHVGTHCRGALFRDGRGVLTPALEERIDAISRTYPGFFFGRYDIRGPDLEAIREGRSFKIIELNGVTSEATHIYDPGTSLLRAYRDLRRQWRIAFEIGAANIRQGTEPVSLGGLWRLARDFSAVPEDAAGSTDLAEQDTL